MDFDEQFENRKILKIGILIFVYVLLTAAPVIIHHFYAQMNWYWISFIWIFIYSPLLVACYWIICGKKLENKTYGTSIKLRHFLYFILWFWFLDIVYMTIFNEWTIAMYVLVIITILLISYRLVTSFYYQKYDFRVLSPFLVFNFLVLVGLIVYLIFRVSDESLRTIITAIFAAILTGVITLAGVAWTIKQTNEDKKNEEIKKYRPFVFVVDPTHITLKKEKMKIEIADDNISQHNLVNGKLYKINHFVLENADYSHCTFKGFCINNNLIPLYIGQAFRKNEQYIFDPNFEFRCKDKINKIFLLFVDMLDNYYTLEVNFDIVKYGNFSYINIRSGIELSKCVVNFKTNYIVRRLS